MELSNKKISFPWWFSLILFLLVSPMFYGPLIALVNPSFFGGTGETELNFGITLFIARNLAIGLAFLFAIYIKNGPMLFILILVRLITDLIMVTLSLQQYLLLILKYSILILERMSFRYLVTMLHYRQVRLLLI